MGASPEDAMTVTEVHIQDMTVTVGEAMVDIIVGTVVK